MSAVPKAKLTPAEYLAIERKAAFRSEYLNGEMFAMAGASYPHTRICDNLVAALRAQFKNGPCYTLSHDMRVKVTATGLYTYPDVIILCGPPELEVAELDTLLNQHGQHDVVHRRLGQPEAGGAAAEAVSEVGQAPTDLGANIAG